MKKAQTEYKLLFEIVLISQSIWNNIFPLNTVPVYKQYN